MLGQIVFVSIIISSCFFNKPTLNVSVFKIIKWIFCCKEHEKKKPSDKAWLCAHFQSGAVPRASSQGLKPHCVAVGSHLVQYITSGQRNEKKQVNRFITHNSTWSIKVSINSQVGHFIFYLQWDQLRTAEASCWKVAHFVLANISCNKTALDTQWSGSFTCQE